MFLISVCVEFEQGLPLTQVSYNGQVSHWFCSSIDALMACVLLEDFLFYYVYPLSTWVVYYSLATCCHNTILKGNLKSAREIHRHTFHSHFQAIWCIMVICNIR